MFDLWKLKRKRRRTVKFNAKAIAECNADKARGKDDLGSLNAEKRYEIGLVDGALNAFASDRLIEEARDFDVETPSISNDESGLWEKDWIREQHFLNAKGRFTIRKHIDEEKERRFEVTTR